MKVRHKTNRDMIVDLGDSWEPMEQEEWQNVTEECELTDEPTQQIIHERISRYCSSRWGESYRLRKVTCDDMIHEYLKHAFIVERRRP